METVTLTRTTTGDDGTFGTISVWKFTFFTGELPWRDNETDYSCIPAGTYTCTWDFSPKFGRYTYLLSGVPGRSEIRIHPANYMGDKTEGYLCELNGCISLGKRLGEMSRQKAIMKTKEAVEHFESFMNKQAFLLKIVDSQFSTLRLVS